MVTRTRRTCIFEIKRGLHVAFNPLLQQQTPTSDSSLLTKHMIVRQRETQELAGELNDLFVTARQPFFCTKGRHTFEAVVPFAGQ